MNESNLLKSEVIEEHDEMAEQQQEDGIEAGPEGRISKIAKRFAGVSGAIMMALLSVSCEAKHKTITVEQAQGWVEIAEKSNKMLDRSIEFKSKERTPEEEKAFIQEVEDFTRQLEADKEKFDFPR